MALGIAGYDPTKAAAIKAQGDTFTTAYNQLMASQGSVSSAQRAALMGLAQQQAAAPAGAAQPAPISPQVPAQQTGPLGTGSLLPIDAQKFAETQMGKISAVPGEYQAISNAYAQRTGELTGLLSGFGNVQREQLSKQYEQAKAGKQQELVSRGLTSSSAYDAAMRGLELDYQGNLRALEDQLTRQQMDYRSRLTGEELKSRELYPGSMFDVSSKQYEMGIEPFRLASSERQTNRLAESREREAKQRAEEFKAEMALRTRAQGAQESQFQQQMRGGGGGGGTMRGGPTTGIGPGAYGPGTSVSGTTRGPSAGGMRGGGGGGGGGDGGSFTSPTGGYYDMFSSAAAQQSLMGLYPDLFPQKKSETYKPRQQPYKPGEIIENPTAQQEIPWYKKIPAWNSMMEAAGYA